MKGIWTVIGLLVLAFGLGCLNYTSFDNVEHHREWAAEYGLPEPSRPLLIAGAASTSVGAWVFGFALGRPRKRK